MAGIVQEAIVVRTWRSGLACLALALGMGLGLRAQEDRTADHAALRALRDTVTEAINKQDVQALSGCMAKSFTFTTVNQRRTVKPEELKAVYDEFFHGPAAILSSYTTNPEADALTQFLDDRIGVATGISRETYILKGGKRADMTVRWTATVIKEGEAWKVAAVHVGVDPLDNPILSGAVSLWKKITLGALLGGLALGFVLARLTNRKKG